MTGRRREHRRRFLRRKAPLIGRQLALHQWNGDAYRSNRSLGTPGTIDVAGPDGVWHRLGRAILPIR